ncbi:MAG: alginate lyase family protein [Paludibacter sp.]|nr:alginate lyase family protein [Paludibacter sp.]
MNKTRKTIFFILTTIFSLAAYAQHPGLLLTPKGVKEIKSSMGKYPGFDKSLDEQRQIADQALAEEIIVPVPKDGGGGYTHEKHKNNYYEMYAAGIMYQLTGKKGYAQFVQNMLLKYADLYPTLGLHPAAKSSTPGKLFWQALNEAVWLVHTSCAYDCVYNYIDEKDRKYIEKNLFYPIAEFISNGNEANYEVFNKMHNHGTWATAAVGMIGYAMGDKDLVDKALYGSNKDGKSGFIRQLDILFSPDGYFTEGPYYQRYAIWPFMTFAQVIQNKQPELNIFNYRNGILNKAVHALVQSAYDGEFFFLNDALPKTYHTQEVVYAVDIAYKNNPANTDLLNIAKEQNAYIISDAGIATAKAVHKKKYEPLEFKSEILRDGPNGDEGGVGILRSNNTCMVFKATSHGLSHGHFDKLSISLYDNGNKILTDYGAVRFLNIEPKDGGRYTKENESWAKQTIAHNTVTVDGTTNFNDDIKISSLHHSNILYSDVSNKDVQIVSGTENNAYKGVKMQRTLAMINNAAFEFPVIIDIYRIISDTVHTYDFPFYYRGQLVATNFGVQKNVTELKALGSKNGYQHLWLEGTGKTDQSNAVFTWVNGNRFYTITTLNNPASEFLFTRVGAGDPNFNLRDEPCFMQRIEGTQNQTFVSVIEPHGLYDLTREVTVNYKSNIKLIKLIKDDSQLSVISIETTEGESFLLAISNDISKEHNSFIYNGESYKFSGNYYFSEFKN